MSSTGLRTSAQRIARLAWPVLVGQLAVLGFATVDTVLVARYSSTDLAALAVGSAAYITVFIGLMGMVLAVSPIVGQHFGARRLREAGHDLHQAIWLCLAFTAVGSPLLLWPEPFLALSKVPPGVEDKVRQYLMFLALALPASLLFAAFRGFNIAISRPKVVMALQLGTLALKVPLSAALAFGFAPLHLPALGVAGCGLATTICMWAQMLLAWRLLRRDPFYQPFALQGMRLYPPSRRSLRALLKLGVPSGMGLMVEVTGFSFMAIFIARLGATPVAGHQIAVNLVSLMFMVPLALSSACSTLVAQRIGAGDKDDARRIGWHGLQIALGIAALMGCTVFVARESVVGLYTADAAVIAAALPLLAWLAPFHVVDAAQTVAAFVLRAWHVATLPMVIYVLALWGLGLGGGYVLAFNVGGQIPQAMQGARGYWLAATAGLAVAALALCTLLALVMRRPTEAGALTPPAG